MKHHVPTLLQALLILILCGIPGRDIPHVSFLEMLAFDKWVHAGIFFALNLFAMRGCLLGKSEFLKQHAKWATFVPCVLYGGLLEILQGALFAERSADVLDFYANSFGCVVAVLTYNFFARKLQRFNFPEYA
ncbi:MAG: VanZ family protein [Bacteroidia bacterium]